MRIIKILLIYLLSEIRTTLSFKTSNIKLNYVSTRKLHMVSNGDSTVKDAKAAPTTSLGPSVINLAKNCVGAGVFSIHSRVATSTGTLPIPAVVGLIYVMAAWAIYNFFIIEDTCRMTESTTYAEAWSKAVSPNTQWIVQTVVVVAPIVSCLANVIVLTDILKLLFKSVGLPLAVWSNRNLVISLLTTFVLFPLCIQSDLSALKSVSVAGLFGHILAMIALATRLYDKSYLPGGKFHSAMVALPVLSSSVVSQFSIAKWSTLASLLSYIMVTHYNAPRYYSELKDKETNPKLLALLPLLAYGLAGTIYVLTFLITMKMFGTRAPVFALNGFSSSDGLGTVARVAFGTSVLASFPLIFLSMRNWFVIQAKKSVPWFGNVKRMTAVLLCGISLIATRCTDIGLVGSIAGGLLGSNMMFIFPPIMYMRALYQQAKKDNTTIPMSTIVLNTILMILGGSLGAFGTVNSILGSFKK